MLDKAAAYDVSSALVSGGVLPDATYRTGLLRRQRQSAFGRIENRCREDRKVVVPVVLRLLRLFGHGGRLSQMLNVRTALSTSSARARSTSWCSGSVATDIDHAERLRRAERAAVLTVVRE